MLPPNNLDTEIFVETPRITPVSADIDIPSWVKKNVTWWSEGQLTDHDFTKAVEYLVQQEIISVPTAAEITDEQNETVTSIPSWVKNNAVWWSEGQLTDVEFANGIQYLVSTGLIKV